MKDRQLKALVKVADEGSIRAAARAMHLSQSALTKSLRELETDVGTELMRRSSRGVSFTNAGELLVGRARLALAILGKARDEIDQMRGGRTVSVGVTAQVVGSVLPRVIEEFRSRRSDARVCISEMVAVESIQRLRDGSLDFAVGAGDPGYVRNGVDLERLASAPLAVVCRVGHPLAQASRWEELADAKWLLNVRPGTGGAMFVAWVKKHSLLEPCVAVEVTSTFLALELLPRNDLLSVMPLQMVSRLSGLTELKLEPAVPALDIGVLKPAGIPLSSAAREMATIFEKYLRG